jgi:hypothetical protein
MENRTRGAVVALVMVTASIVPTRAYATQIAPTDTSAAVARVRSDDPLIATLLREGPVRSRTFAALVQHIDASDGIVFIDRGRCGRGVRACLALRVTMAGPSRLLRIIVDARKADSDLIASVGHELRHALEVLADATVTSNGAIYFLYKRIGTTSVGRFETKAAVQAGDSIRIELRRGGAREPVP